MKLNNYYQTLTEKQKEKIKEKVATSMFYNWYDELREDFSLEEAGAILLAILFYDRTHGEEEIPADLMEVINRDRATKHIFLEYTNKTAACTRNWLNIHGKRKQKEEDTSTESPLKCPTMPQSIKEGHDTTPPPKSDLRAENEVIETYGCVMDINEEDGVLFIDEGGTYTFNPDENPNITDFIEKFVVISHNSKNEIINIEEDTPF